MIVMAAGRDGCSQSCHNMIACQAERTFTATVSIQIDGGRNVWPIINLSQPANSEWIHQSLRAKPLWVSCLTRSANTVKIRCGLRQEAAKPNTRFDHSLPVSIENRMLRSAVRASVALASATNCAAEGLGRRDPRIGKATVSTTIVHLGIERGVG